jgi:hypothetical protein
MAGAFRSNSQGSELNRQNMKKFQRSPRFYLLLSFIYLLNAIIWIWLGLIPRNYPAAKLILGILWFTGALIGFLKFLKMRQRIQASTTDICKR